MAAITPHRPRRPKLKRVTPSVLRRIAYIIGPHSAAQKALDDAAGHTGPVEYYSSGSSFIVVKK